ncbi:MAG: FprA family A-type flavoprotein [Deltaproteobacteria bacterium]|nr:FprA family A-type flavoprotein [Deltaproteobacteria bacterium]
MNDVFQAVKITDHVYWVGAIDWNIRDFHGYRTHRGSTYNAYLVVADHVALIDTVKVPFLEEMFARIASIVDPSKIRYIISHHAEMDHSGGLPAAMERIKPERLFASVMGGKALKAHFDLPGEVTAVKDGEILSLGNMNLAFHETRMLHWPDSMASFLDSDRILFSQDAFGMHLATAERFADEINPEIIEHEAATYFANILLPYSRLIETLLDKVGDWGHDIGRIAPDHGPVWRKNPSSILEQYGRWAAQRPQAKAIVLYDTMWKSTEKMARAVAEGVASRGVKVKVLSMAENHRSDAAFEILDSGAIIAGSPTLNNNIFPTMADVMTYLKGLKPLNRVGAAFGSYGWSGESISHIQTILSEMKVAIACEPVKCLYVPDRKVLKQCYDLGSCVADVVKKSI